MHGGRAPRRPRANGTTGMAIELGLCAMNMPKELGGGGLTMFQQVLVSEQLGRVTNALGWCVHTPPAWAPAVVTPEQLDRWIVPTIRGERHECYAITEEGAGSDVDAIAATARRDGDDYVLERREDARDLASTRPTTCFFQAKIDGGANAGAHAMFFVDKRHARRAGGPRARATPTRTPTTHAIVAFEDVRVPASNLVGAEGDGHGVHLRVVPLRAADDRRPLLRRGGAADRRGDRVREGAGAVRRSRSSSTRRSAHAGGLAHRALGRAAHDLRARRRTSTAAST